MTPKSIAENLLTKHDLVSLPIDVKKLAGLYEIKIIEDSFEQTSVSAVLVYKDGKYFIGINNAHSQQRQRFSIAHELGHFFIHKKMFHLDAELEEGSIMYRDDKSSLGIHAHEIEANVFAANLLMPETEFRNKAQNNSATQMAQLFNVSVDAVLFRCKNIGIACCG